MSLKSLVFVSAIGVAVLSAQAYADTLRLRDGRAITGTFLSGNENSIRFQSRDGGSQSFDLNNIDSITFGSSGNSYNNGAYREGNRERGYNDRNPGAAPGNPANDPYLYRGATQPSHSISSPNDSILPAGTVIMVRTIDPINSDASHAGETYRVSLDQPITINGRTVAPVGSDATMQVVRLQQGGRIRGEEEVSLALASFTGADGRVYNLNTSNENISSVSRGKQSGEVIGGGAALGAIIGAIAGGGRGAAIGAASGAALGTGAQLLRGVQVKVPAESRLSFTLTHDVRL